MVRHTTKIEILIVSMLRFVHAIIYSASDAITYAHGSYLVLQTQLASEDEERPPAPPPLRMEVSYSRLLAKLLFLSFSL